MKTVYFVRHGESEANVNLSSRLGVFQGELSPLIEKGCEQARFIARRATNLPIEIILASPATRAHETALEIQRATGKPLEVYDFFTERRAPSSLLGHPRNDPTMRELLSRWHRTFYETDTKVEDGENFEALKARVCSALQYLSERSEQYILVATHGFFLHMVISVILLGEDLSLEEFRKTSRKVWMNNTGITQIEYFTPEDDKRLDGMPYEGWVLRIWNDHAHLG